MIISDKYRLIYIRIPKTGSTSIEEALIKADPDCIRGGESPPYGHESANTVRVIAGEDRWNSYFKFCTFREPTKWFLSMYLDYANYSLAKNHYDKFYWFFKNKKCSLNIDFDNPVIDFHDMLRLHTLNRYWYHVDDCWLQSDWVKGVEMDKIIKLEDLEEEWPKIKSKFNFDFEVQKKNVGIYRKNIEKLGVKPQFSEKAKKLFLSIYEDDVKFYNSLGNKI